MSKKIASSFIGLFLIIFFLLMGFLAYNYSQSERFGDETAHMVGGHLILKNKKIYQDLQFNHQPLNYYFSAIVEKITSPKNLYFYISRQRLTIYLYSVVWNIIYISVFGSFMIFFIVLFEFAKYWYSGYKLLAETIAVYPLLYLFGFIIHRFLLKKNFSKLFLILFSISSFISGFSLLPLWVVIIPLNVLVLYSFKNNKQSYLYLICPFLFLIIILFSLIRFSDFFRETFVYNTKYFVPETASSRPTIHQMILLLFMSFIPPYTIPKIVVSFFLCGLFISALFLVKKKKANFLLTIFFLFVLTNFFRVGDYSYQNFHLLPWFATLLIIELSFIYYFAHISKDRLFKKINNIKVLALIGLTIIVYISQLDIFKKKDLLNEYYINYSDTESYGRAISILKDRNDKLLVIPNDPLIYWVCDMIPATHVLEYYSWIYKIPEYQKEIKNLLIKNPPNFIVDTGVIEQNEIEKNILMILRKKYVRLNHVNKPSKLYILNNKIEEIDEYQWKELKNLLYTKPII